MAVIGVPIAGETTFEDPSVTSPAERARLFLPADDRPLFLCRAGPRGR